MGQSFTTQDGKRVTLERLAGAGGEGEVWTVQSTLEVAKIYHPHILHPRYEHKLSAMIANPPVDEMRVKGHISIAWPTDLLYREGKFAGFLMPGLEKSPTIFSVYNPIRRAKECPGFNWMYLFHTGLNLSKAIEAIHSKHYLIGDINESNIRVKSNALVTVIDTDSFQVIDSDGVVHRCLVGKEDYTPPELRGKPLDRIDRKPTHDYFGLGVLLFRLLMEGYYPFAGVLNPDAQVGDSAMFYCLERGAFPYERNPIVTPPPMAPRFEMLDPEIRKLFLRCFVAGYKHPQVRPSSTEWVRVLGEVEKKLVACKTNKEHHYLSHLSRCPWCEREARKKNASYQTPLPPARPPARQTVTAPVSQAASAQPTPPSSAAARKPPVTLPSLPQIRSSITAYIQPWTRSFFHSNRFPVRWRSWWTQVRKFSLWGCLAGTVLFLVFLLMFQYPLYAAYGAGGLTAAAAGWPVFLLSRRIFRSGIDRAKWFGAAAGLVGGGLSLYGSYGAGQWILETLPDLSPDVVWLFIDTFTAGMFIGAAVGNYKALSWRKSKALASLTSFLIAFLPLFLMGKAGLFGLPFDLQPDWYQSFVNTFITNQV
jgi:serine/threonine protein kinase